MMVISNYSGEGLVVRCRPNERGVGAWEGSRDDHDIIC